MAREISSGFAFYGNLPEGCDEQHLGIVLGVNDEQLKYCYCTSKDKFKRIKLADKECVKISAETMAKYFCESKETYIFISQQHLKDILLTTFESYLTDSVIEGRGQIINDIFTAILSKIRNSDNLSDRFKEEFFDFIG